MDLERNALRPPVPELRGGESGAEEQGAASATPCLGEQLRRHHAEREPCVDELVRELLGGEPPTLHDRVETDLLRVADALVEVVERLAVVQVRRVDGVPDGSQVLGEAENALRDALRMVEEQDLGHADT